MTLHPPFKNALRDNLLVLLFIFAALVCPAHLAAQQIFTLDRDNTFQTRKEGKFACHAPDAGARLLGTIVEPVGSPTYTFTQTDQLQLNKLFKTNKKTIASRARTLAKTTKTLAKTRKPSAIKKLKKKIKALKAEIAALKKDNTNVTSILKFCAEWPGPFTLPPPISPTLPPEPGSNSNSLLFLDSFGYTKTLEGTATTIRIFVSSSQGDDSNSGYSRRAPVRTLARGYDLIRANSADQLLLRRGDTWNENFPDWSKSGYDDNNILVIGSYADNDSPSTEINPRPIIRNGKLAIQGQISNVAVTDLHFIHDNYSATSAVSVTGRREAFPLSRRILVENCKIEGYPIGIHVTGESGQAFKELYLRRNIILRSFDPLAATEPAGVRIQHIDYVVLQGNVFDHNGWDESFNLPAARFDHKQLEITGGTGKVLLSSNYFLRGADLGALIETTDGMSLFGNVFAEEPRAAIIKAEYALVTQNVVSDGVDMSNLNRGWGIDITAPSIDAFLNLFINARSAAVVYPNQTGDFALRYHGPFDLGRVRVQNNVIYNFPGGIQADSFANAQPVLGETIENNIIIGNDAVAPLIWVKAPRARWFGEPVAPQQPVVIRTNRLYNPALPLGKLWTATEVGLVDGVDPNGCRDVTVAPEVHALDDDFYDQWRYYVSGPNSSLVFGTVGPTGSNNRSNLHFCPDSIGGLNGHYGMTGSMDYPTWQVYSGDTGTLVAPISLPDTTRTIGGFVSYLGVGEGTIDGLAQALKGVDKSTRTTQLRDALFIYQYLGGGFIPAQ